MSDILTDVEECLRNGLNEKQKLQVTRRAQFLPNRKEEHVFELLDTKMRFKFYATLILEFILWDRSIENNTWIKSSHRVRCWSSSSSAHARTLFQSRVLHQARPFAKLRSRTWCNRVLIVRGIHLLQLMLWYTRMRITSHQKSCNTERINLSGFKWGTENEKGREILDQPEGVAAARHMQGPSEPGSQFFSFSSSSIGWCDSHMVGKG